ncbi:hypothetical protein GJ496_009973 [Pomphorhynchus laevis]|nr:hypothetical protein GJ496_009973 [Pomphorhynchus laevis]
MKNIYKQMKALDMNQDGKITVEDFILLLKEKGLGPLSKPLAKRLFNMADSNKNGVLEFQDVVKLMELLKHVNLGALNLA